MKNIIITLFLFTTVVFAKPFNYPYYLQKKSQFEMLAQNEKYETVMLGDSITDGGLWNELLNYDLVQNRGIAGDTTEGVLDRLDSINVSIKKVFIMIGINDFFQEKSVDEVFANYKKIIKILEEKKIKVYIQSTLYVGENRPKKYNEKVELLNEKLKKLAIEKALVFIDLNKILAPKKTMPEAHSYDELHLNGVAYKLWVQEIRKYF